MEASDYLKRLHGVRVSVQIMDWFENWAFVRTLKASKMEAALVHDLARVCVNPDVDEKKLNIKPIVLALVEAENQALAAAGEHFNIDKTFLVDFLEQHLVQSDGNSSKEQAKAMAMRIIDLGPVALKELTDKELSRSIGRRRVDLLQIHPALHHDELLKVNQRLNATVFVMDQAMKARDRTILYLYAELSQAREAIVSPFKRSS